MDTVTTLPRTDIDEGLTRADLDALPHGWPHDGRKVELLDGVVVMSAAPRVRHQLVVDNLVALLKSTRTAGLRVVSAPVDVRLSERTVMQPDVLVALIADFTEDELPCAPLLAVEVLSPSTRRHDLLVKRELLEQAGCPSFWLVDPGDLGTPASLVALELVDGAYVEVARASGDETWRAERPFAVDVTPDRLLDE